MADKIAHLALNLNSSLARSLAHSIHWLSDLHIEVLGVFHFHMTMRLETIIFFDAAIFNTQKSYVFFLVQPHRNYRLYDITSMFQFIWCCNL